MTLRIAQPGELCAMKQSPSTKIRESMLWNTKEQSGRGFNHVATSALGLVTVALVSAAPELDFTLINKLTDDKRSVVFDDAVRSVPFRLCMTLVADQDHIGWKSWILIARTIIPTPSFFVAQRPPTCSQGSMGKFGRE